MGLLNHSLLGHTPTLSDSAVWSNAQQFAFLTHFQVMLLFRDQIWEPLVFFSRLGNLFESFFSFHSFSSLRPPTVPIKSQPSSVMELFQKPSFLISFYYIGFLHFLKLSTVRQVYTMESVYNCTVFLPVLEFFILSPSSDISHVNIPFHNLENKKERRKQTNQKETGLQSCIFTIKKKSWLDSQVNTRDLWKV